MKRTKKILLAILATLTAGFCALGVACGKDESSSSQSIDNEPTSSESTGGESGKDTTDESVDLQGLEFYPLGDGTYGVKAGSKASYLSEITIPATYQGKKVSVILGSFFGEGETSANVRTKKIIICDGIEAIEDKAFASCSKLTSVVIPDSVKSIAEQAFNGCSSLTSIEIPDSVTSIGSLAFNGCSSLTTVPMPTIAIKYIPKTNLQTVILTSGKSIAEQAFYGCSSLTSIEIPDSVTSIGERAFYNCSSLMSVVIPDSVTSVDDYTFYGCNCLISVVIPDGVTSIGSDAFAGCSSLTSIEIPHGVTSIGERAFAGCSSLTSITFNGTKAQWGEIKKYSLLGQFIFNRTKVICTDGEITL